MASWDSLAKFARTSMSRISMSHDVTTSVTESKTNARFNNHRRAVIDEVRSSAVTADVSELEDALGNELEMRESMSVTHDDTTAGMFDIPSLPAGELLKITIK